MPTFLETITAQPMRERLDELRAQSPDIQTLFFLLGPERILEAHYYSVPYQLVRQQLDLRYTA